jgi:selenocysteine lyase/cysteine desulfurase
MITNAEHFDRWIRSAIARLLGGARDDICPQQDLSTGLARILQCVPGLTARREILLSERAFPSLGFVIDGAHNLMLGDRLRAGVPVASRVSPAAPGERGGTVILDFGEANDAVAAAFADNGIHVDRRVAGFRLSPHVDSSDEDIDAALAVLQGAVASGPGRRP